MKNLNVLEGSIKAQQVADLMDDPLFLKVDDVRMGRLPLCFHHSTPEKVPSFCLYSATLW